MSASSQENSQLLSWLSWLLPPKLNDEERDDRAKVLAILLSILLGLGILLVLIDFFIIPPINLLRSQIRFGLMVAISLPLLILLRRGYIDTVAYGFIIALWAFSTYLAATGGGIYATAVQTFLLITFLAILIGGRRFAVWIGILSVFTEICLAVFQSQIPTLTNRNPLSQLIVNIVYLVAIILVQDYSVRSLRRAMRKTIEAEKERQQAETTLIESQERFKAIFDQAEIGVVLSDLEGRFIEANQAFCQFVGYTISELQKLGFPELTRESDLKLEFEFLHDVMTGSRRSYTLEKQYIRRDGTLIPVNLTVSLLRDLNNEPKAYLRIIQDISEKYSAEIALQLSEEHFRIIFENAGLGIAQIDDTGHFVACNHAYTEIMGYTEAEILQHSFQDFMRPEDLPISDQGYKDLLTGTIDRYSTERQYIHKTGRLIWGRVTISLYRINKYDNDHHVVIIFEDISAQKEAELEIAAYNERLEESVENRTQELSEALQISEQALKARDQFVANVSHELRTPLNAVIGLTHLALATQLDNKQRDYLNKVKTAASDLLQLVNDLLDFSKLEARRMELESISFPLKEMLKSIIDLELVQAKRKDLNLKLDCANNLPDYVIGDAMRIRQVLLNLISNAIKFTERGGIAVQVNVSNDKQMIEFCVADTGIGIPESLKPMLFTPFRQADGSITRRFGGTGLGLAICRQIVEHMGGSIYLDESWHQGSRFVFKIPLQVSEVKSQLLLPENSEVLVTKSVFESVEKVSNSQGAVLLVEDNEINSIVANELLRSFGLTVDIASNGKEGVAKALANRYSIILMDLQMPIMDGYEATRIIRENKIETPIIAVTAHVLDSEIQKCFDNGMNDHVAKPIDPETLYTTLSKWISLPEKPDFNLVQKVKPISFELPGFDVESAVHRLDNDESLYLSLLQFFVRDHLDDAYHLERAIQSNELHQIRHIVHRLKGASANLSAQHILNILLRIDEAIETTGINLEILNPIINELKNEIHTSIPLIEKLLTKRQSTLKRKTESNKKVSWLDLDTLLSRQSLQAKDCFYQLTEQRHRSDSAVIKKIENAINHLDYSLARSLLAQVIIDTKNENHFLKGTV